MNITFKLNKTEKLVFTKNTFKKRRRKKKNCNLNTNINATKTIAFLNKYVFHLLHIPKTMKDNLYCVVCLVY